jgi:hypothetical protein
VKLHLLCAISLSLAVGCAGEYVPTEGQQNPGVDGGDQADLADAEPIVEPDNRVTDRLQVLYRFQGSPGQAVIQDVSEVGLPYNLTIRNPELASWEDGYMTFLEPNVAENLEPVSKVIEACRASNELSVEFWVKNASIQNQGRVVTSSQAGSNNTRNFGVKQNNATWESRLRTSQNNANGTNPAMISPLETASIEIQHIVYTRDSSSSVADFYINGTKQVPKSILGNFGNWALDYGLFVGNEETLQRPWLGTIYLLAVYCKDLSPSEVLQNYNEGY